jgi:hypothetical protein
MDAAATDCKIRKEFLFFGTVPPGKKICGITLTNQTSSHSVFRPHDRIRDPDIDHVRNPGARLPKKAG